MEAINIDQLSEEQMNALQEQLARKAEQTRKKKEAAKKAYERKRDSSISSIVKTAAQLEDKMKEFKARISVMMSEQHEFLTEYGEIRSNSKGGFSITSSDGSMRVTRTRDTEPYWDERGTKAVAILKEFLEETAKKRDKDLFEILMGFLQKNDKGDLEYSRVFHLLKHRNSFTDPRWTEGLNLLEESFQTNLKGYGYEVKVRNEQGKWDNISLNFTSL